VELYNSKFGAAKVAQMVPYMTSLFAAEGVRYSMGGLTGNTFDSHRLIEWAGQKGPEVQHALVAELFNGYFSEVGGLGSLLVKREKPGAGDGGLLPGRWSRHAACRRGTRPTAQCLTAAGSAPAGPAPAARAAQEKFINDREVLVAAADKVRGAPGSTLHLHSDRDAPAARLLAPLAAAGSWRGSLCSLCWHAHKSRPAPSAALSQVGLQGAGEYLAEPSNGYEAVRAELRRGRELGVRGCRGPLRWALAERLLAVVPPRRCDLQASWAVGLSEDCCSRSAAAAAAAAQVSGVPYFIIDGK
jgi:hypothetical protein